MAKYVVTKKKKNYNGTNGNDTFTTAKTAGSFSIFAKGGNDRIFISRGSGTVDVGKGSDYVEVTGGKVERLRLSEGRNEIKVTGGKVSRIVGDGHVRRTSDIINVSKQKSITITTSYGADSITVKGINNALLSKASKATIETNDGNDTITISGGGLNRINTGYGKDNITISAGSNYVKAGAGSDTIVVNSKYGNYIKGDAGADRITLGKNARRCVVEGGDQNDTITVKSTASGKIGNLVKGGNGSDTYDVHYKQGMTLVVDARNTTEGPDTLKLRATTSDPISFEYFKKKDVMEIYGKIHVIGFSKLKEFNFIVETGTFSFKPKEIINTSSLTLISNASFDINKLLSPYNTIANGFIDGTNSSEAKYMGYKGY